MILRSYSLCTSFILLLLSPPLDLNMLFNTYIILIQNMMMMIIIITHEPWVQWQSC
jgi:hypothetical protein